MHLNLELKFYHGEIETCIAFISGHIYLLFLCETKQAYSEEPRHVKAGLFSVESETRFSKVIKVW